MIRRVAQLVEQHPPKVPVVGSTPTLSVVGDIAQVGKSMAVDNQACLVTAQPDWSKLAGCIQVLRYAGL